MLFLIFKIDDEKYAIPAKQVAEIIDLVKFTKIPQSPDFVSGLMNYRGNVLPVIDLPNLFLKRVFKPMLSTRIVLMNFIIKKHTFVLGIIVENLTETIMFEKKDIKKSGLNFDFIPYLGKVISNNGEIIHLLEIEKVLPEELKASLFKLK